MNRVKEPLLKQPKKGWMRPEIVPKERVLEGVNTSSPPPPPPQENFNRTPGSEAAAFFLLLSPTTLKTQRF